MDHEVVPCSSKICDWSLNLSWDHSGLHQGEKIVRVILKSLFLGLDSFHCRDPMGVVVGEIKEVLSLQMLRDDGKELLF